VRLLRVHRPSSSCCCDGSPDARGRQCPWTLCRTSSSHPTRCRHRPTCACRVLGHTEIGRRVTETDARGLCAAVTRPSACGCGSTPSRKVSNRVGFRSDGRPLTPTRCLWRIARHREVLHGPARGDPLPRDQHQLHARDQDGQGCALAQCVIGSRGKINAWPMSDDGVVQASRRRRPRRATRASRRSTLATCGRRSRAGGRPASTCQTATPHRPPSTFWCVASDGPIADTCHRLNLTAR